MQIRTKMKCKIKETHVDTFRLALVLMFGAGVQVGGTITVWHLGTETFLNNNKGIVNRLSIHRNKVNYVYDVPHKELIKLINEYKEENNE